MKWLSKLFRIGKADRSGLALAKEVRRPDEGKLAAELCMDLRGSADGIRGAQDALEALYDAGLVHVVDWADSPDMVLENLARLFAGNRALSEGQIEAVLKMGDSGTAGRGQASHATLCALDEVLTGTGTRLLNLDASGDGYNIARVSDGLWQKWHDVALSMVESGGVTWFDFSVLQLKPGNEVPANRVLRVSPR